MGFFVIAPFAVLATWSIYAIRRWLRKGGFGPQWWKAFWLLCYAGAIVGICLIFVVNYNVANKHIEGFPIPLQISDRQQGGNPAVADRMPVSIRIGGAVTNWLCGVAICLVPIAIAAFFKENRSQQNPRGNPRPNNSP
jgi:hypothetical protein